MARLIGNRVRVSDCVLFILHLVSVHLEDSVLHGVSSKMLRTERDSQPRCALYTAFLFGALLSGESFATLGEGVEALGATHPFVASKTVRAVQALPLRVLPLLAPCNRMFRLALPQSHTHGIRKLLSMRHSGRLCGSLDSQFRGRTRRLSLPPHTVGIACFLRSECVHFGVQDNVQEKTAKRRLCLFSGRQIGKLNALPYSNDSHVAPLENFASPSRMKRAHTVFKVFVLGFVFTEQD
jgi:hypothetical protein